MRAVSDRCLAEPYRSWIDRRKPLPADVIVLPRAITPWLALFRFVVLLVIFWGLGLIMLAPTQVCFPRSDETEFALIAGVLLGILFLLTPVLVFWEFLTTLRAVLDQKRGRLRQGILIGPSGILVRLKPNECHTVEMCDFNDARACLSKRDNQKELYRIETTGGTIEFAANRMESRPHVLSQMIARFRWKARKPED